MEPPSRGPSPSALPVASDVRFGRAMCTLWMNGKEVTAFIDTGSEVTLVKSQVAHQLHIPRTLGTRRTLTGVSGSEISADFEFDASFILSSTVRCVHRVVSGSGVCFPGDLLIGMDWLRRFNFMLVCYISPPMAYLVLNGVQVPIRFTDEASCGVKVSAISTRRKEVKPISDQERVIHVARTTACPPHSGCYVAGRISGEFDGEVACISGIRDDIVVPAGLTSVQNRDVSVWVVNDRAHSVLLKGGARFAYCSPVVDVLTSQADDNVISLVSDELSTSISGKKSDSKISGDIGATKDSRKVDNNDKCGSNGKVNGAVSDGDEHDMENNGSGSNVVADNDLDNFTDEFDAVFGLYNFGYDSNAYMSAGDQSARLESTDHELFYAGDTSTSNQPQIEAFPESEDEVRAVSARAREPIPGVYCLTSLEPDPPVASPPVEDLDSADSINPFPHLTREQGQELRTVLDKYPILFQEDAPLGKVPGIQHHIHTWDDEPVNVRKWRLPEASRRLIREECDKMLRDGIVEPSTSPYHSPVVLVRKKDGELRFCADYRQVNSKTRPDAYPMSRVDQLLDDLGGSTWFTTLDARSAYWTIEVAPADRPKTAFSDGHRLLQFVRMPFGLATAPSTFQRAINFVLAPVLGRHTLAYLDDVVVYSQTYEEHLHHLDETLSLLSKAGFRLNHQKCFFATQEFKFLGFRITTEGVLPDPEKVAAIKDMPRPRNVREVRRFLGCSGFFRRHVPKYSDIASPLTKLTKKNEPFKWTAEQEEAFAQLKTCLITAPVLRQPNFAEQFELHCDASGIAIGGCLMQRDTEGLLHPISYFSRKLRDVETKYSPIDVEALAVVEGVRHFDAYLYGRHFVVYTDHRPLIYVFKRKTGSLRMSRWCWELTAYSYDLRYKRGASNHVPDALSRAVPDPKSNEENVEDFLGTEDDRTATASFNAEHLGVESTPTVTIPVEPAQANSSADVAALGDDPVDPLAPAVVAEAQKRDPLWQSVYTYLTEGEDLPAARIPLTLAEFELENDAIYHIRELPGRIVRQLVIPQSLRKEALKVVHDLPTAGHQGVYRTYQRLRELFYFPNMLAAARKFVKECGPCQRRKGADFRRARLQRLPDISLPLQLVSVDLLILAPSRRGYRYLLTAVDHLTRYVILAPLRTKTANEVALSLINYLILVFGPPQCIQADNGREFRNAEWTEVCDTINAKTRFTVAYRPQSNGMIERTHRVIKDTLACVMERDPEDWDQAVPYVQFAMNTAIHRSIQNQPLYLMTGCLPSYPVGHTNLTDMEDSAASSFRRRLEEARQAAVQASRTAQESWAAQYNMRVRRQFQPEVGQLVLVRNYPRPLPTAAHVFRARWKGPCRLVKQIGPVTWRVRPLSDSTDEQTVHTNQLKAYYASEELEVPEMDLEPVENHAAHREPGIPGTGRTSPPRQPRQVRDDDWDLSDDEEPGEPGTALPISHPPTNDVDHPN